MSKDIDWGSLGFGYIQTDKRFVANYKDGAWDAGTLTGDATVTMSECACVLQYAQTCFEGLKAYRTEDAPQLVNQILDAFLQEIKERNH